MNGQKEQPSKPVMIPVPYLRKKVVGQQLQCMPNSTAEFH
jgi:hypothetical protein